MGHIARGQGGHVERVRARITIQHSAVGEAGDAGVIVAVCALDPIDIVEMVGLVDDGIEIARALIDRDSLLGYGQGDAAHLLAVYRWQDPGGRKFHVGDRIETPVGGRVGFVVGCEIKIGIAAVENVIASACESRVIAKAEKDTIVAAIDAYDVVAVEGMNGVGGVAEAEVCGLSRYRHKHGLSWSMARHVDLPRTHCNGDIVVTT